jgi:hypothetical protein
LQSAKHKQDAVSSWANQLMARRNNNIASVALANKNARTVWALLAKREYCAPIISAYCLISKTETTPPIAQASMMMARQVRPRWENPVYSRLLKERFVDRASISVFHQGQRYFTSPRQSPDLWLQSMTSKATTTYLAWQTGGDHL